MNIRLENIVFDYNDENKVFNGLNLNIYNGQTIAVIGHNGSGKSTLAKLIMGLIEAKSGNIYINDTILNESTVDELRKHMGIIFQNPDNQFVGVTVEDDVAFGLENRCVETDIINQEVKKYLDVVSMSEYNKCNPEELSGGQKQRVAIAGALALNTDLLIFDESTSMLDPKCTNEVLDLIKNIKEHENKTIIMITHNLQEVLMCDRVIVLNNGNVALDGTPEEVFKNSKLLEACNLKNISSLKVLEDLTNVDYPNKKEIEKAIWELTFHK